jgi:predicted nucleic acid-binding protein
VISQANLIIDASVAVKWYVPEIDSEKASALLVTEDRLIAPDLLVAEFGNILWKKVGRGELTVQEVEGIVNAFLSAGPIIAHPSHLLLRPAVDIAITFQRTVYDALYLALAVAEQGRLITADERLVNALQGTRLERFVQLLANR